MLVNVTDVFLNIDKEVCLDVDCEMTSFSFMGDVFPVIEKDKLKLTLSNQGRGKARAEGVISFVFAMSCDRCLKEIEQKIRISFQKEIVSPEYGEDIGNDISENDGQDFMEGYQLNIETLINSEVLVNWPSKVLCNSDCKGICSACGCNLNQQNCDCDTFIPDPRLARIKDIFNADKEV